VKRRWIRTALWIADAVWRHRVLVLATGFGLCLLVGRVVVTGRIAFAFLVWNLFLAWLPLCGAELLRGWLVWRGRCGVVGGSLGAAWLLFLPNAPYLVTDLGHWRARPPAPAWFDLVVLCHFALLGLALGFAALDVVAGQVVERCGRQVGKAFRWAVLLLASFGIYLGRFERWNSWDVLRDPVALAQDVGMRVIRPWEHPRTVGFTLLCFALLAFAERFRRGASASDPAQARTVART
jgi:uncharacterized membrane protein